MRRALLLKTAANFTRLTTSPANFLGGTSLANFAWKLCGGQISKEIHDMSLKHICMAVFEGTLDRRWQPIENRATLVCHSTMSFRDRWIRGRFQTRWPHRAKRSKGRSVRSLIQPLPSFELLSMDVNSKSKSFVATGPTG